MNGVENYDCAVKYICDRVGKILEAVPEKIKANTYEIRLRSMRSVTLVGAYGTFFIKNDSSLSKDTADTVCLTFDEIKDTFSRICLYSVHTFQRCINSGYIPMEKGNRVGVCGTAVCEKNNIISVKDITSLNIRLARQVKGCGDEILNRTQTLDKGIIIAGPPSSGKTTIIRDIVRQISSGRNGSFTKTVLIDERREISGIINGVITHDIGITCDILDSYPKAEAIDIAVRTFSPEVIVCDEVSTYEEINAVRRGINCGVKFIVTVHAGGKEELFYRKQIAELILTHAFSGVFLLGTGINIGKIIKEYDAEELLCEISNGRISGGNDLAFGFQTGQGTYFERKNDGFADIFSQRI